MKKGFYPDEEDESGGGGGDRGAHHGERHGHDAGLRLEHADEPGDGQSWGIGGRFGVHLLRGGRGPRREPRRRPSPAAPVQPAPAQVAQRWGRPRRLLAALLLRYAIRQHGRVCRQGPRAHPPQRARDPVRRAQGHPEHEPRAPRDLRALPRRLLHQIHGPLLLPQAEARDADVPGGAREQPADPAGAADLRRARRQGLRLRHHRRRGPRRRRAARHGGPLRAGPAGARATVGGRGGRWPPP